jgi:phage repressor protein C with HTH and peptisase S24 domain
VFGLIDRLSRPLMRVLDPEDAHTLAIKALRLMPLPRPAPDAPELTVRAFGLNFPNPVGLAATNTRVESFVNLITDGGNVSISNVPLIGFAEAGTGGYFDDGGFPVGKGWEEIAFPAVTDEHAYALEISGDSMKPAYRKGDIIVVSPAAAVRRGDRVVVKTKNDEVMVKELKRKTNKTIELKSLNSEHRDRTLQMSDVVFVARVVWASQ